MSSSLHSADSLILQRRLDSLFGCIYVQFMADQSADTEDVLVITTSHHLNDLNKIIISHHQSEHIGTASSILSGVTLMPSCLCLLCKPLDRQHTTILN